MSAIEANRIWGNVSVRVFSVIAFGSVYAALSACQKKPKSVQIPTPDAAVVVQQDVKPTVTQTDSLSSEVETRFFQEFLSYFSSQSSSLSSDSQSLTVGESGALARAASVGAAKIAVSKAKGTVPSLCSLNKSDFGAWTQCLVREVLSENLSDAKGLKTLISEVLKEENKDVLGDIAVLKALVEKLSDSNAQMFCAAIQASERAEKFIAKISSGLNDIKSSLEIISSHYASIQMPFLAKSFFEGRSFVLTTSFQQGSVGQNQMTNLDSHIVSLKVNNNRLIVLENPDGLYDGSNSIPIILGSYPIVATVPVADGEIFYQIDFSQPENKQFLLPTLGDASNPSLSMSADIVVPKVVHASKPEHNILKSGKYFDSKDRSFVLDQLVLVNGSEPFSSVDSETAPQILGKDAIRPTVHVVQGFMAIEEQSEEFWKKQAQDLSGARNGLMGLGVEDRTGTVGGNPYFTSSAFLPDAKGRPRDLVFNVRKYNIEKPFAFVIGKNTPASVVPVMKSAVNAYRRLFETLTPAGKKAPVFTVETQQEFEDKNRTEGIKFGDSIVAADPRVNMIFWDDNSLLGSAWATTVNHPQSGEVISADVMFSGTTWAEVGCKAFFERTWLASAEKPNKSRPAAATPSAITRFIWDRKCEATMLNLGIYRRYETTTADAPQALVSAAVLEGEAVTLATRNGDTEALARIASAALGKNFNASDMIDLPSDSEKRALAAEAMSPASRDQIVADLRKSMKNLPASQTQLIEKTGGIIKAVSKSGELETEHTLILRSGSNLVKGRKDCSLTNNREEQLAMAEAMVPQFETKLITTPEQASLAMLKFVVLHELGHTFGLRHNFMGSLTNGELMPPPAEGSPEAAAPAAPTVPVLTGKSDSIMDYNDNGVYLDFGAMPDFKDGDAPVGHAEFGLYDVLALANIYGLDASGYKIKSKPAFCTDDNRGFVGNCQTFDFGKDFTEYTLLRANLTAQRLRVAGIYDGILDPSARGVWGQLLGRYMQDTLRLAAIWGTGAREADITSRPNEKQVYLKMADFAFRAKGGKQEFLKDYAARFGMPVTGLSQSMTLPASFFYDAALGEIFSSVIRADSIQTVNVISDLLRTKDVDAGLDAMYLSPIRNIKLGDDGADYRTELAQLFLKDILVPAGTPMNFEYLDGGWKPGSELKMSGKPAVVALSVPFFNHTGQTIVVPNLQIDAEKGQTKTVTAKVRGIRSIAEMQVSLNALSSLATGTETSESVTMLKYGSGILKQYLEGACTVPGGTDCFRLSDTSRNAAQILQSLMNQYAVRASYPNVASGQ